MKAVRRKTFCLDEIMEQASIYDKEGKPKLAEQWMGYAERYEKIITNMNKDNENREIGRR